MRDTLEELFIVIAYSQRTQLAIFFGALCFISILMAGDYFASHFELHGLLAPMTDVIREKIIHRYDKVAWFALGSFWLLAFKCYKKDRKRLLQL
ncbi:hypothetical protein [Azonexus sp. IMCC34839]|uniref:hypothetical protein n=1 Tax=Azonexus sp. IMCC34839 TaxID=3133695 RepID=UPI003999562B